VEPTIEPLTGPQAPEDLDVADRGIHPRPATEPDAGRRRWQPSNLTLRLFTAAMLIPPLLWVCHHGGLIFVAVVVGINCLAVTEFYGFISEKGATPHRLLGTAAVAVLPAIVYFGDAFMATSFLTAVLLGTMILQLTKQQIREAISSLSATFFGVFYVGWLMSHAVSVRFISDHLANRYGGAAAGIDPQIGFFFMMLCLFSAVGCDVGAYFVGRRYGRRRLAPTISPNKTVEGALGGLLAGALFGAAVKFFFDEIWPGGLSLGFPYAVAVGFGVALAAAGILGDLIESLLKRDAALKDAGSLLPGVGGVLDRIDSALMALPVMYYLLLAYYYFRFMD
jgi:phosphatidate cytidylyltransferase